FSRDWSSDVCSSDLKHHLTTSDFNKKTGQYEDFLRMVYPLLEIAERGNLESRLKYLENLLSNGEKAILIYSASFIDKKEFAMNRSEERRVGKECRAG